MQQEGFEQISSLLIFSYHDYLKRESIIYSLTCYFIIIEIEDSLELIDKSFNLVLPIIIVVPEFETVP